MLIPVSTDVAEDPFDFLVTRRERQRRNLEWRLMLGFSVPVIVLLLVDLAWVFVILIRSRPN